MTAPLIYAVTLNWNRAEDTLECLGSLAAQDVANLHLVVVDNGSTDSSVDQIQTAFPDVKLVANDSNMGFARGMNRGIQVALENGADYVLVLNNDTFMAPDMVSLLLAEAAGESGLLAPIIYYADDPQRIWSVGGQVSKLNLETTHDVRGELDTGQWPAIRQTDFITGCAMFLPHSLLTEVGAFDEGFFMYYEDLDLCNRIRSAGYNIRVVTAAKMWHKVSLSSGGSDSPNERYWMARSSVHYFRKHARFWQWPLIIGWRAGSALRTSWRLWRQARGDALRAYWRGLGHGLQRRPL